MKILDIIKLLEQDDGGIWTARAEVIGNINIRRACGGDRPR